MDVHVEDIEHYYNTNSESDNKKLKSKMEDTPENKIPINVVKQNKHVSFNSNTNTHNYNANEITSIKPLPKSQTKMVRPIQQQSKPQVTYDDILSKMGMFVVNGELHLKNNNQMPPPNQQNQNIHQNSYIYNKYFKDNINNDEEPRRPQTLLEYRDMLIKDIIQKAQIRKIKSKKLIMPNSNINISGHQGDLNKLFRFSQR